jgi:hypothetical protein
MLTSFCSVPGITPTDKPTNLDAARAQHRARLANPQPYPILHRVAGEEPLVTLAKASTFSLYDFMEVCQLSRAHAIRMMARLAAENVIAAAPQWGRYYVIKANARVNLCMALVPHAQAAPQFATRYIRDYVLSPYVPMLDYDALLRTMSLYNVSECPF